MNLFGIELDDSAPFIVLLCAYYLILSVGVLLTVLNICMYLFSIYIFSHEKFLNKIHEKKKVFLIKKIFFIIFNKLNININIIFQYFL